MPPSSRELGRRLRPALLAVRAHGDRRQPLGAAPLPHGAEAPLRARLQLLLPWQRRRTIIVVGPDGAPVAKPGNVGPQVDPTQTTKVVEFNDSEALRAALSPRDVAAVLMEPVMTNIGIVLRSPTSSRPCARSCGRERHAADQRQDAHALCRHRWLHARLRPAARRRHRRQGHRQRHPHGRLWRQRRVGGADPRRPRRRPRRHRRGGRHAGGQRALHGGRARHARACADGAELRAHDRPRDALRGGHAGA